MTQAPKRLPVSSNSSFYLAMLLQCCVFTAPLQLVSRAPREIPSEQACLRGEASSFLSRVQPHLYCTVSWERQLSKTHTREFLKYWHFHLWSILSHQWSPPVVTSWWSVLKDYFSPVTKLLAQRFAKLMKWELDLKRLWHKSVAVIFLHQKEALEPEGSLLECSEWWCLFWAQSDGALHKGNSITRLTLSLWGKFLPVEFLVSFFASCFKGVGMGNSLRQDAELDGFFFLVQNIYSFIASSNKETTYLFLCLCNAYHYLSWCC